MTGAELKTVRESLLLSAQGLAERLAHDGLLPVGNVRTVQRWEEGARPVPEDIAAAVRGLDQEVEAIVHRSLSAIRANPNHPSPKVILRFETDSDFKRYHSREAKPQTFRLHIAALVRIRRDAEALGQPFRIVSMNREEYESWRFQEALDDDQGTREAWAGLQIWNLDRAGEPEVDQFFIDSKTREIQRRAFALAQKKSSEAEYQALVDAACEEAISIKTHEPLAGLDAMAGRIQIIADTVHGIHPIVEKALLDARNRILTFRQRQ